MKMTTAAQAKAAMEIVFAITDATKDLGSVPSGHLYARLMGRMSMADYTSAVELLKRVGAIKEENHLLTYIGPK